MLTAEALLTHLYIADLATRTSLSRGFGVASTQHSACRDFQLDRMNFCLFTFTSGW